MKKYKFNQSVNQFMNNGASHLEGKVNTIITNLKKDIQDHDNFSKTLADLKKELLIQAAKCEALEAEYSKFLKENKEVESNCPETIPGW